MSDALSRLLDSVDSAVKVCSFGREAALVERTCVTGSLGRGTFVDGREATGLVLFLNIDLQFGMHEADQARDALSAAVRSGLAVAGWEVELRVVDADCRGGLWADLHVRNPEPPVSLAPSSGSASNGQGLVLQLFLAENMTTSVRPLAASDASAAPEGADSMGNVVQVTPDEERAAQQQHNLIEAAEQRARREARHQGRHGATKAAGWAKLGCGVAEARRVFWSRQPEAARRAARSAHATWAAALAVQGREGQPAVAPSVVWSDEVMHLLDVLALHVCREGDPAMTPTPNDSAGGHVTGAAPGATHDGPMVARLFTILSTEYGNGAGAAPRIGIPGGLLAQGQGTAGARAGHETDPGGVPGEPRVVVVLDPCFSALDVYEVACAAMGQAEGASAGQLRLRQVAEVAVKLVGS